MVDSLTHVGIEKRMRAEELETVMSAMRERTTGI